MGKNNNNNPAVKHQINIQAINQAREVLTDYRCALSISLLSDIEAHYKWGLSEFDRQMKTIGNLQAIKNDIQVTRTMIRDAKTRKDRLRDLASHQAQLEEKKRDIEKIVEKKNQFIAEYERLIPFSGLGPTEAHYKKRPLLRENDPVMVLADLFEALPHSAVHANNVVIRHLHRLYKKNEVFRKGIDKAKILPGLIQPLQNVNDPKGAIEEFSRLYRAQKATLTAHRDGSFERVIEMIFKLFETLSPVLGLTGATKLWQSDGKKATKKVDTILKKHNKSLERITPKTK